MPHRNLLNPISLATPAAGLLLLQVQSRHSKEIEQMTPDELYASVSTLETVVHRLACNPTDAVTARELRAALGQSQWLWHGPTNSGAPLEKELASARWWAKDLTHYDAKSPGLGKVGAVLSLRWHLLAIIRELKHLGA
jgi:hypothetical protein